MKFIYPIVMYPTYKLRVGNLIDMSVALILVSAIERLSGRDGLSGRDEKQIVLEKY